MAADVSKNLERAKKFLEKNRVEDAIEAYLSVLEGAPQHLEATQALGDLYTRLDQPERALIYYGYLFELLVEPKDETITGFCATPPRNRPSALLATPFSSRSRITRKKRSSSTPRPRRCLTKPGALRMPCSAGNARRNSIRTIPSVN